MGRRRRKNPEERAADGDKRSTPVRVAPGREEDFVATSPLTPRQAEIFQQIREEMQVAGTATVAFRRPATLLAIYEGTLEDMRRYIGRVTFDRGETGPRGGQRRPMKNSALGQIISIQDKCSRLYDQLGLTVFGVANAAKTGKAKGGAAAGTEASEFDEFN